MLGSSPRQMRQAWPQKTSLAPPSEAKRNKLLKVWEYIQWQQGFM